MTDTNLDSLDTVNALDSATGSSPEIGPSGHPIVRTEDGIITEGSNALAADRRTILGQKTVVAAQARRNGRRRILDGIGGLALGPHRVRSLQYSGFGRVPRSA